MSENRYSLMDLPVWHYQGTMKNTKVSAQTVTVDITLGGVSERLFIFGLFLGPDDQGAGRTTQYQILFNGIALFSILKGTLDNQQIAGPKKFVNTTEVADTVGAVGSSDEPFPLTNQITLRVIASALAQDEEVTFSIFAFHHSLGAEKPAVALVSVTDRTLTEDVNVIS